MPAWAIALIALGPAAVCIPVVAFTSVPVWAWLVVLGIGCLLALSFWLSTARRWIRVDDRALRIGDRPPIPLRELGPARRVEGPELKQIRLAMTQGRGLPPSAAALGAVPAAANIALGAATIRNRRTTNTWGMLAQPWMHQAVLVETPTYAKAPSLLIGTRRPQELLAALRNGAPTEPVDGLRPER